MDLPKIRKQLTDLMPSTKGLFSKSKSLGAGLLLVVVGAFTSSANEARMTPTDTAGVSAATKMRAPKVRLVLQQSSQSPVRHVMHYSHQSHESHYSHQSHYSHYSSRY